MCLSLCRFEVHVSNTDTVESVKEKVAASQLIAFPEHKLMFKGEKMEEGKTMSDYGIQESAGCFVTWESCPFLLWGRGRSAGAVHFMVHSVSLYTHLIFGQQFQKKTAVV